MTKAPAEVALLVKKNVTTFIFCMLNPENLTLNNEDAARKNVHVGCIIIHKVKSLCVQQGVCTFVVYPL